ncbi:MAG: hypothetical protein LC791_01275 [Acidobacteria bacterium]|nr:hypothetical protein [Acidobacteriota bacterium]
MSPILTRPVREQLEHDRIIRLLQGRYRRKYEAAINPGNEQNSSVAVGEMAVYPDVVLFSQERNRRLQGTVEVETGESVNTLEALAQWGPFSRLKVPFHLYVPPNSLDTARRLCAEHQIVVAEIWTYHPALDQVRFTMVYRAPEATGRAKAANRPMRPAEEPARAGRSTKTPASTSKPVEARKAPARRAGASRTAKSAAAAARRPQRPTRSPARAAKAPARKAAGATKRR